MDNEKRRSAGITLDRKIHTTYNKEAKLLLFNPVLSRQWNFRNKREPSLEYRPPRRRDPGDDPSGMRVFSGVARQKAV